MANNDVYQAVVASVVRALREERLSQGLSMDQVAAKSGLSQSTLSLLERDLRSPTLDSLLRIATVLNIDLGKKITSAINHTKR